MNIYRCEITLMEAMFFSSREISDLYQTEPLIGNYALAYAFGFCRSSYFNDGRIGYKDDLLALKEQGVYLTPAGVMNTFGFLLRRFNAQTDGHWSAYGAGVVVGRSPQGWSEKDGMHWYTTDEQGKRQRHNPTNRPQAGRIRLVAAGAMFVGFILSQQAVDLPRYIRLGKFMSKARVVSTPVKYEIVKGERHTLEHTLLNPADLAPESTLSVFDLINVPPTPLINNALIEGSFYKLATGDWLPYGMGFNMETLP